MKVSIIASSLVGVLIGILIYFHQNFDLVAKPKPVAKCKHSTINNFVPLQDGAYIVKVKGHRIKKAQRVVIRKRNPSL